MLHSLDACHVLVLVLPAQQGDTDQSVELLVAHVLPQVMSPAISVFFLYYYYLMTFIPKAVAQNKFWLYHESEADHSMSEGQTTTLAFHSMQMQWTLQIRSPCAETVCVKLQVCS